MQRLLCILLLVVTMAGDVQFTVEAVDNASSKLRTIDAGLNAFSNALRIVGGALRTVQEAMDATVGEFVKYADQVRTLSQVTGASADQTSRLIQLSDDHKVSVQNLTTAMRAMSTQGHAVTIESLGKMSDAYLKLNPGLERQQYLMKNFGRAGVEFAEMMLMGSEAIDAESAAISKNLILTEKAVQQAREYEIAMDNLQDTMEGVKIEAGQKFAPALIYLMKTTEQSGDEWMRYIPVLNSVHAAYTLIVGGIEAVKDAEKELGGGRGTMLPWQDLTAAIEDAGEALEEYKSIAEGTGTSLTELAIQAYITELTIAGGFTADDARKVLDYRLAVGDLTEGMYQAQLAALLLQQALSGGARMPVVNLAHVGSEAEMAAVLQHGTAVGYETGGIQQRATGGAAKGWLVAGDPSPQEELIYAPGGAYVFTAAQTRAMKGKGRYPHFAGGALPSGMGRTLPIPDQVITSPRIPTGITSFYDEMLLKYGSGAADQWLTQQSTFPSPYSNALTPAAYPAPASSSSSTQAVTTAVAAAASSVSAVSEAATTISESGQQTADATRTQTAVTIAGNQSMLEELRGLRRDIKTIIPRAIQEGYQKVVGQ